LKTLASCFERLIMETKKKGVDFFSSFPLVKQRIGDLLGMCLFWV